MTRFALLLGAAACSDYGLGNKDDAPDAPSDPTTATTPSSPGSIPTGPPGATPVLTCEDDWATALPWVRSPDWTEDDQPVDGAGLSWYEPGFEVPADWYDLPSLPDEGPDASDNDVFYRARFWLDAVVGTTELSFVGNDGVWLYANGTFLGHWGSEWRDGGCINVDDGSCKVNEDAAPTDVTGALVPGENVLAVMLTNGPKGYYLDIGADCVE